MPTENRYDLYITDQDRNIIREERAIDVSKAEKIIREYPWHDRHQSNAQFWKTHTKYSLTVHFMESENKFQVGFSDKASRLKLPLPYVGATYGIADQMEQVIEALHLFFKEGYKDLERFLATYRAEQKGDEE